MNVLSCTGVTWQDGGTHHIVPVDNSVVDRRVGPRAPDGTSGQPAPLKPPGGPGGKLRATAVAGGNDRAKFTGLLAGSAHGDMLPSMTFIKCTVDSPDLSGTTVRFS